jgi:predicted PurR-regulated permease PerM
VAGLGNIYVDESLWAAGLHPLRRADTLDEADVQRLRAEAGDAVARRLRSSSGSVVSGVLTAVEVLTGLLLALVTTFFMLKDGRRFGAWAEGRLPAARRELGRRLAARAWDTLGGYLRGAAMLGLLEGVIIGVTLAIVGGGLAVPVAVLTFGAAFVPFAGAIVAGVVAVLVALATSGLGGAVVVAIVALVVQQLDNDFLSPVIYGRALQLHPLVVLFAIVAGGALFGPAGTILAVPATAVALNMAAEATAWASDVESAEEPAPGGDGAGNGSPDREIR